MFYIVPHGVNIFLIYKLFNLIFAILTMYFYSILLKFVKFNLLACLSLQDVYLPRWKSRIHVSIYKRHSTAPVVNKEQCLYWIVGTGLRFGAILAQYSPSPETKCRLITDFGVMPVLNQYRFQCWHGTDVQFRIRINGQLPANLPFIAVTMVSHTYTSTMPIPSQYYKSFCGTGASPNRLEISTWFTLL